MSSSARRPLVVTKLARRAAACSPRIAAVALLVLAHASLARGADEYEQYTGRGLVHQTDRFAYSEHHFLTYRDGKLVHRLVLYTCADGSAFARKTLDYVQPAAPDFLLEDASSGLREGVRGHPGHRMMFFRGSSSEKERSTALPAVDGLVIDAGFDQFMVDHWTTLVGQTRVPMRFLVPSRGEFMNFEVEHLRRETVAGTECEVFRLKLAGLLGWLMSGIEVAYSRTEHRLVRYEGLSDLRDSGGSNIAADIYFDPALRGPGNAAAEQGAREQPLAHCPAS